VVTNLSLAHGDPLAANGPQLLVEGRHWVAAGAVEGLLLVLQGRDLDAGEVELVRVTDVEPYVEGTRRLEEAARARALGHRPGR
jgi:hypothetical protein